MADVKNRRLVSFVGNDYHNILVAGNHDVWLDKPVASMEDIRELQECICHRHGLKTCAIMSIIKYEEE